MLIWEFVFKLVAFYILQLLTFNSL